MPVATGVESSQNISKTSVHQKPSSAAEKTNIGNKNKKNGKKMNDNIENATNKFMSRKCNQCPLSPVTKSSPQKKSKNNDDDLIVQLEASDKEDIALKQQLQQTLKKSSKFLSYI